MRLGIAIYLAAAVAVVYFSHAVLVHGAHDAHKVQEPVATAEKPGIVDRAKASAQEAVHQVKDKAGQVFGKKEMVDEVAQTDEELNRKDQTIMDKIKGVFHSGKETVHHGAETARRAKDVKDTVEERAKDAVIDKAKDLLHIKHSHDKDKLIDTHHHHHESIGDKVDKFIHKVKEEEPTIPTKEAKEPVKELAKDFVEMKAKATIVDKVKEFLHLKPTVPSDHKTVTDKVTDKLKDVAESAAGYKVIDTVVDKAKEVADDTKEKIRDITKNTEYASDDNKDRDIVDKVKDFLHMHKDKPVLTTHSAEKATILEKAEVIKEAAIDAAQAGYETFVNRIEEGPATTATFEPARESIIDKVKDFLHIGKSKTDQAADKVRETADDVKRQAQHASDSLKAKTRDAKDDIADKARDAKDTIVDKVIEVKDDMMHKARDAKDAVVDKAREARDDMMHKARDAKDAVVGKARDARDDVVHKARDAKDAVIDGAHAGKERAKDAADYVHDKAMEAAGWGKENVIDPARAKLDKAEDLLDAGREKTATVLEDVTNRLKDEAVNTDTEQTPVLTDTDKSMLTRAKDTIQSAIKRCFARSKHSGELIEVLCDNATTTGGYAGVYEADRLELAAKDNAEDAKNAAKKGDVDDAVRAAKDGLKNTANAAKEGLRNAARGFVEA